MTATDQPLRLVQQIAEGAEAVDLVQLHGAIVAALELYQLEEARHLVLDPALERLSGHAHQVAAAAVGEQLAVYSTA